MLLEARILWLDRRNEEAFDVYDEILDRWPDDRQALIDYAHNLFYRWYYEESAVIANRALEFYPRDDELLTTQFACYGATAQYKKGLESARRGVMYHPGNPNMWDSYGTAFLAVADPDSAEFAFQKALSIDPTFLLSQQGLALLSYCRGDIRSAIDRTEALLGRPDLSPSDIQSTLSGYYSMGLAQYLAEAGSCERALHTIDRAWPYAGDNEMAKQRLGNDRCEILMRAGRYRETIDFTTAMQDTVFSDRLKYVLEVFRAGAFAALGDVGSSQESIETMREDATIEKDEVEIVGVTADLALVEGRTSEAIDGYLQHKKMGGWTGTWLELEGRVKLARACHMAGRSNEAIAELKDLVNTYKGHALGHYELGKVYEDLGRVADAEREYTVFLEMWSEADEDMPQLIDARGRLAGLKSL
jgi:tetratricopeptide (TPR) repeat protein